MPPWLALLFQCAPERAAPGDSCAVYGSMNMNEKFQCAPERAAPGDGLRSHCVLPTFSRFNALLNAQPPGTHPGDPVDPRRHRVSMRS